MPYTYPPAAPTLSGDVLSINRFLRSPGAVSRRLRTLLEQRYIADALLSQRLRAEGGAISYETGESIFSGENPRAVAPGTDYPLVSIGDGTASLAKTVKWGQDTIVTDESIARQRMQPVERSMTKLANQSVKYIDSVALSAVASAVTQSTAASAAWTTATAEQMLEDVMLAKANVLALNEGYDPDVIVLSDLAWAYAFSKFVAAGFLPREAGNPLATGNFPMVGGMIWLPTPNLPVAATALVADRTQLGGMADENLGGDYQAAGPNGVESKSIREDAEDRYRLRARRVTVPVVLEPAAGWKITGLGV